jgi:hypothetical protein
MAGEEPVVEPKVEPVVEPKTSVPVVKPEPVVVAQTVPLERFQSVVAERRESERALEEARRQLALTNQTLEEFKKLSTSASGEQPDPNAARQPPAAKPLTAEQLRELVSAQTAQNEFDKACNSAVVKGREAHKDFDAVLDVLKKSSPFFDPRAGTPVLPRSLVEAALETGAPDEVLYALGQNPAEADRLMQLSSNPVRVAAEITRFHAKLVASKNIEVPAEGEEGAEENEEEPAVEGVSRAPAPIRERAARGTRPAFSVYDTKNTSSADWIAKRQAEVNAKRKNGMKLQ